MPRVQPKKLSKKEKRQLLEEFWDLLATLKNKKAIEGFLQDLLSETEAVMLARRIRIARLLLKNKSYDEIKKEVGAAYATTANVHKWLQSNHEKYRKILHY